MRKTIRGVVALAIGLAAAASFALPSLAFAADPSVAVSGHQITPGTYYLNAANEDGSHQQGTADNYNFYYDEATTTLHLKDADIKGDGDKAGIAFAGQETVTIKTEGDGPSSVVGGANGDITTSAITVDGNGQTDAQGTGNLVVEGVQKLVVDQPDLGAGSSSNISARGKVTIDCDLQATGNCGVHAPDFVYKGGHVVLNCKDAAVHPDANTFTVEAADYYWRKVSGDYFRKGDYSFDKNNVDKYLEFTDSADGIKLPQDEVLVIAPDGTETWYSNADLAVFEWEQVEGSTMRLFADVFYMSIHLQTNGVGRWVLDLNGYTLWTESAYYGCRSLTIKNGALKIGVSSTNEACGMLVLENMTLSLPSSSSREYLSNYGTIVCGKNATIQEGVCFNREGGKIVKGLGEVTLGCSEFYYEADAKEPDVTVENLDGDELTAGQDYTVGYSDNVNAGTAKVTVTGKGEYGGIVEKTFTIEPVGLEGPYLSDPHAVYTYSGKAFEPKVVLLGRDYGDIASAHEGVDFDLAYTNNVNAGTATVTATGKGNYTGVKSVDFTINPLEIAAVELSDSSFTYTGKAIQPDVTLKDAEGNEFELGDGCTVAYQNNVNVGTATAKVELGGNFTGEPLTATFEIKAAPAKPSDADKPAPADADKPAPADADKPAPVASAKAAKIASAKLSKTVYTYKGKALKPSVKVKGTDGKMLKAGRDFTVVYSANKSVGKAKVTVKGKGKYAGAKKLSFIINPKGAKMAKCKGAKKSFIAKWKKQPAKMSSKRIGGYQIRYSKFKNMTMAKTKKVKGYKKTSVKVVKAKAKGSANAKPKTKPSKKRYVQVRTYMKVGGKTYYSSWSKAKSVKMK